MRFADTPELAEWRKTVQAFVDENWKAAAPAADDEEGPELGMRGANPEQEARVPGGWTSWGRTAGWRRRGPGSMAART
jgi:hypothetical protein